MSQVGSSASGEDTNPTTPSGCFPVPLPTAADTTGVRRLPTPAIPAFAAVLGVPTVVAPGSLLAEATYTVAFTLIVVMAWLGVRARSGAPARAGAWMAATLTVWLTGDLLYSFLSRRFDDFGDVTVCGSVHDEAERARTELDDIAASKEVVRHERVTVER